MKLTMLGTGGAFTRVGNNYHNNALVEFGELRLLVDCSLYALDALDREYQLTPLDIDGVVVTHLHGDHVSGLEELGFRNFFFGDGRPELYCHPRLVSSKTGRGDDDQLDLWEHCLRAGMQKIRHPEQGPIDAELETYFDARPTEAFRVDADGREVRFNWFATDHAPGMASFGLEMRQGDSSLCYTGDARPMDEEFYRKFDTILHDCMLTAHFEGTSHTHLEELVELPADIQQKIHLMHYGDVDAALEMTSGERLNVAEPGSSFEL